MANAEMYFLAKPGCVAVVMSPRKEIIEKLARENPEFRSYPQAEYTAMIREANLDAKDPTILI